MLKDEQRTNIFFVQQLVLPKRTKIVQSLTTKEPSRSQICKKSNRSPYIFCARKKAKLNLCSSIQVNGQW
jgi:hypothetical protein